MLKVTILLISSIICVFFGTISAQKNESPLKSVKIGQQVWASEDLKTTVYNNGDKIKEAKSNSEWEKAGKGKVGCYRRLKNGTYIYNGYALTDARGILPEGYRIPTEKDFEKLISFLGGGSSVDGKASKALASYNYIVNNPNDPTISVNLKSSNKSGFTAKKGGFSYPTGETSDDWGACSYWWASNESDEAFYAIDIGYCSQDLGGGKNTYEKEYGFAVRCIKK